MDTSQYDFSSQALDTLREEIRASLSERRYMHIVAVEQMIDRLGTLYLPTERPMLRAAALLHDLTKEFSNEKHEKILQSHGIIVTDEMRLSPKLYHAQTASLLIPAQYPHLASPTLLSAVRCHTTGRADATVFDLLLYLADYIDDSRTFPDCILLREFFWDKHPDTMESGDRLRHLFKTIVRSVDLTVSSLTEEGVPISVDSILMRNHFLLLLKMQET